MGVFLKNVDITDNVIKKLINAFGDGRGQAYFEEVDNKIYDIAEKHNTASGEIELTPIHFVIKRFALYYFCWAVARDYMGTNAGSSPVETEVYNIKMRVYASLWKDLEPTINYEMLTGNIDDSGDRNYSYGIMLRSR